MASPNKLVLAVAGSRKTHGIVTDCAAAPPEERTLILTYTSNNQAELRARLGAFAGNRPRVEVAGWFSFLLAAFVRPFLPFAYPGTRARGFDYTSLPTRENVNSWRRYFNADAEVRRVHLPQLATRIEGASNRAGTRRLARLYDRIVIDEVQDLNGYDLEILRLLLTSSIPVQMVGDVRQAILATNERERKNKQFMFMNIWSWFQKAQTAGLLDIEQRVHTWRCRPEIAALADAMFDSSWGFQSTVSLNDTITEHDGVFLVRPADVDSYVDTFSPMVLRKSANSGKAYAHHEPLNFGKVKGLTAQRVLVCPTKDMEAFIKTGRPLTDRQASDFYVAITRAEQSVAIIAESAGGSSYPFWSPT